MTIWACQAGKDVYVEKPCSHNIFEAKQIVAAARKYNRMVQQGSQSRSSAALQEAVQKMRDGLIGDVYMARGLCFKWRDTIGRTPVEPVPAGVDYDLWTGPAPQHAVHQESFPLQLALVLGLRQRRSGQPGHPRGGHRALGPGREVSDEGDRHRRPLHVRRRSGNAQHPQLRRSNSTTTARSKMMEFEVRHWMSNHEAGINETPRKSGKPIPNTIGNVFYGSKGYLAIDGYNKYTTFLGRSGEPGPTRPRAATTSPISSTRCAIASGKL